MAMAFAVAKAFDVQNMLEKELLDQFAGQQEIINRVIEYARAMLEQTKGGLLAGISAVTFIWAALKVMDNIEHSLNDIWAITTARPLRKKFSDYLAIIIISPLLLIMSGSATVLIVSRITMITEKVAVLGVFSPLILLLLKLVPWGFICFLFTFIYVFMPNTRVTIRSGLVGGLAAGTAFKFLQWAYIYFQVGVSRYNAIYGSFAALPLFLIWLELSWLIVLFGAELSFAHQNVDEYELEPDSKKISDSLKKVLSLSVLHLLVKTFQRGDRPLTDRQISRTLDIPFRLVKGILSALSASGLINRTTTGEEATVAWQPARDINAITIASVLEALDKNGVNELPLELSREFGLLSDAVNAGYDAIRTSPANVALKDI
jgi:membrane protein